MMELDGLLFGGDRNGMKEEVVVLLMAIEPTKEKNEGWN